MGCSASINDRGARFSLNPKDTKIISCVPFPLQQLIINNTKHFTSPEWCTLDESVIILRVDACHEDDLDKERMILLNEAFCLIFEHIHQHGGYVADFTGLTCVAVFSTLHHGSVSLHDLGVNATHVACDIWNKKFEEAPGAGEARGDPYKCMDIRYPDMRCVVGSGKVSSAVVGGRPNWRWILVGDVLEAVDKCMGLVTDSLVLLTHSAADLLRPSLVVQATLNYGVVVTDIAKRARFPLPLRHKKPKGPPAHSLRGQLLYYLNPSVANNVLPERSFSKEGAFDTKRVVVACIGMRLELHKDWTLMALHTCVARAQEVMTGQKGSVLQMLYREGSLRLFIFHDVAETRVHKALLAQIKIQVSMTHACNCPMGPWYTGVSEGSVVSGVMGTTKAFRTFVALGPCVRNAVAAMGLAAPGRILCDGDVFDAYQEDLFEHECFFVEQQELEAEGAYYRIESVLNLYPSWADRLFLRGRAEAFSGSFAGRCGSLTAISERIESSPHSLTVVTGVPGSGKSAFMATLHQHLLSRKHSVIWCQGRVETRGIPFATWLPVLLRVFCGRDSVDTAAEIEKAVSRKMHHWFGGESKMKLPLLSQVFGIMIGEASQHREISILLAEEREARVCALLASILRRYCQPLGNGKAASGEDPPGLARDASVRLHRQASSSLFGGGPGHAASAASDSEPDGPRLPRSMSTSSISSVSSVSSATSNFESRGRKLGSRVKRAVAETPCRILLVDGLDLFDPASLRLLALAVQIPNLNVVVAGPSVGPLEAAVTATMDQCVALLERADTFQTCPSAPGDEFEPDVLESALTVHQPPLTMQESQAAIQQTLCAAAFPEATAKVLHRCCGGNWAVLSEVVRSLVERGKVWDPDAVKRDPLVQQMDALMRGLEKTALAGPEHFEYVRNEVVGAAMRGRLSAWFEAAGPETQRLMCTMAAMGPDFELAELDACLGCSISTDAVLVALTQGCQLGILQLLDWSAQCYAFADHRYQAFFLAAASEEARFSVPNTSRLMANYITNNGRAHSPNSNSSCNSLLDPEPCAKSPSRMASGRSLGLGQGSMRMGPGQRDCLAMPQYRAHLTNPIGVTVRRLTHFIQSLVTYIDTTNFGPLIWQGIAKLQELGHNRLALALTGDALQMTLKVRENSSYLSASALTLCVTPTLQPRPSQLNDSDVMSVKDDDSTHSTDCSRLSSWDQDGRSTLTGSPKPEENGHLHAPREPHARRSLGSPTLSSRKLESPTGPGRRSMDSPRAKQGSHDGPSLTPESSAVRLAMQLNLIGMQSCRALQRMDATYLAFLRDVRATLPDTDSRWFYLLFARWFMLGHLLDDPNELTAAQDLMKTALASSAKAKERELAMALQAVVVAASVFAHHAEALAQCDKLLVLNTRSPESCAPPPYIPVHVHPFLYAAVYGCRSALYAGRYRAYNRLFTASWDACVLLHTRRPMMHPCLLPFLCQQFANAWLLNHWAHLSDLLDQFDEISGSVQAGGAIAQERAIHTFFRALLCLHRATDAAVKARHVAEMTAVAANFEGMPRLTDDAPGPAAAEDPPRKPEKYRNLLAVMLLALATACRDSRDLDGAMAIVNVALRALVVQSVPDCLHAEFFRVKADLLQQQRRAEAATQAWMDAIAMASEYGAHYFALRAGLCLLQQDNTPKNQKKVEGMMKKVDADMALPEYALAYRLTSATADAPEDAGGGAGDAAGGS